MAFEYYVRRLLLHSIRASAWMGSLHNAANKKHTFLPHTHTHALRIIIINIHSFIFMTRKPEETFDAPLPSNSVSLFKNVKSLGMAAAEQTTTACVERMHIIIAVIIAVVRRQHRE